MTAAVEAKELVIWVGLSVEDDASYTAYRAAMTPILTRYGGRFGYDFRIAEVLKSEVEQPINRVFTIVFPSAAIRDAFFADEQYQAARARFFEPAVRATTILSEYERGPSDEI